MSNNFLDLMNEKLIGLDSQLHISGDSNCNVFIIGAPRSGTTLLNQLFAGCTEAGYVNNLMATFWNSPIAGAILSNRWTKDNYFNGESNFGQTSDYREPHEFGAFWRKNLNMEGMQQPSENDINCIDWDNLAHTLDDITKIFSKPVVYKAFHLMWFINEVNLLIPNSKWIWIKRNTISNARSILDLRRYLNSDISKWASSKPIGIEKYCNEGPYLEVVAQVELINKWIFSQLTNIKKDNWYSLSLESLVSNPIDNFTDIANWIGVEIVKDSLQVASKNIHHEKFKNDSELRNIEDAYIKFLS